MDLSQLLQTMGATVASLLAFGLGMQLAKSLVIKIARRHLSEQAQMLVRKGFGTATLVILAMILFISLGIDLTAVLGAAGIAGIAIGFAAQTSISNVISGLFLLSEKPFAIGDVVKNDEVTGVVLSIDTLSVKIRTFDNTFVRIPNEALIKSKLTNLTRFPIRRLDLILTIPYSEDLSRVIAVLREVVAANRFALANPERFILLKRFAPAGTELTLGVWFERADLTNLKNTLMVEILERFCADGIPMPTAASYWPPEGGLS